MHKLIRVLLICSIFSNVCCCFACSTFVFVNREEGTVVLGKNRDRGQKGKDGKPTFFQRDQVISERKSWNGKAAARGTSTGKMQMTMGTNDQGLAAVINMAPGTDYYSMKERRDYLRLCEELRRTSAVESRDDSVKANAESLLLRYGKVSDVLAERERGGFHAHKIITVVDVHGNAAVMEFVTIRLRDPDGNVEKTCFSTVRELKNDRRYLFTSNHYRNELFSRFNNKEKKTSTTYRRAKRLEALLKEVRVMDLATAERILRDHEGYPYYSVCSHKDISVDPVSPSSGKTIASSVFISQDNKPWQNHVLIGNPCLGEYSMLDPGLPVPAFFSKKESAGFEFINLGGFVDSVCKYYKKHHTEAAAAGQIRKFYGTYQALRLKKTLSPEDMAVLRKIESALIFR